MRTEEDLVARFAPGNILSNFWAAVMQLDTSAAPSRPTELRSDFVALITILCTTLMAIAVVAILYMLRDILIPLSLAVLLSFVLAPVVRFLQRWRCPKSLAAVAVVLLSFGIISALGTIMASEVSDLAGSLPKYQTILEKKIATLRGVTAGSRTLGQAENILQELGREIQSRQPAPAKPQGAIISPSPQQPPIPVEIRQPEPGALETISSLISPLLHPLATTGIIVVFVIFILVQREDLRDRLIRLTGTRDLGRTTAAIDDAAQRLSMFYLVQLALNASFGIIVASGLWMIGLPSALAWGIFAAVLRFVPYFGAIIAAGFPLALAAAVDPGWTMLFETLALFAVTELVIGQMIEPFVYGHSTGLSPVAVIVSATFWTWLWGPIGLVLSTPLTVCLVVLGRHIERLNFLEVMFSDRPALSPNEIFYQRMLASDPAEAADQAEQFMKKRSLSAYYETIAMGGLKLAQADLANGLLDRQQLACLRDSVEELIGELSDELDVSPAGALTDVGAEAEDAIERNPAADVPLADILDPDGLAPDWRAEHAVVCIAGQSVLDESAARMLADLIRKHGLPCDALPAATLKTADLFRLDIGNAKFVCLSFMDAAAASHMRHAVRKARRKAPGAKVMIGAWTKSGKEADAARAESGADLVVTAFHAALEIVVSAAESPVADEAEPASAAPEPRRAAR